MLTFLEVLGLISRAFGHRIGSLKDVALGFGVWAVDIPLAIMLEKPVTSC